MRYCIFDLRQDLSPVDANSIGVAFIGGQEKLDAYDLSIVTDPDLVVTHTFQIESNPDSIVLPLDVMKQALTWLEDKEEVEVSLFHLTHHTRTTPVLEIKSGEKNLVVAPLISRARDVDLGNDEVEMRGSLLKKALSFLESAEPSSEFDLYAFTMDNEILSITRDQGKDKDLTVSMRRPMSEMAVHLVSDSVVLLSGIDDGACVIRTTPSTFMVESNSSVLCW